MKNKNAKHTISFRQAVEATPDIETGYKTGLTALGAYSNRVIVFDKTKLQGSVDIDRCTTTKYPDANRWDYAFAYKSEVFFVEVHSANTNEVKTVLKKLQWLKDWLHSQAPEINKLKAKSRNPFVWVQSKNFQIPKNTPQYFAAVNSGLIPIRKLELN
ncbi:MAG: hypothetical protein HY738_16535 [Bacteroidia bacterium]|nr:hypothetical protein [Bacteroidia bacterium]